MPPLPTSLAIVANWTPYVVNLYAAQPFKSLLSNDKSILYDTPSALSLVTIPAGLQD